MTISPENILQKDYFDIIYHKPRTTRIQGQRTSKPREIMWGLLRI